MDRTGHSVEGSNDEDLDEEPNEKYPLVDTVELQGAHRLGSFTACLYRTEDDVFSDGDLRNPCHRQEMDDRLGGFELVGKESRRWMPRIVFASESGHIRPQ